MLTYVQSCSTHSNFAHFFFIFRGRGDGARWLGRDRCAWSQWWLCRSWVGEVIREGERRDWMDGAIRWQRTGFESAVEAARLWL